MKRITLLFLLLIGSMTSSFGQFSENFDAAITVPAGWSVINGGDPNGFIFSVGAPGSAFSAPNAAQINYNSAAHDDYLVTPQIVVTAGVSDRLTYYVKNQDPLYVEDYEVKLSSTTATAAAFTVVLTPEGAAPDAWTQFTIDLTPYIGQSIYIGFHAVSTDQFRLLFDNIVNDSAPASAPACVALTAPTNAATGVNSFNPVSLTWTAPTTGGLVSSYDVFLDTNPTPTTLLGNQVELTRSITGLLTSTTYYWTVIAKNSAGAATGCSTFSFTTAAAPGYCLTAPNGQWPLGSYIPTTCDGITPNVITTIGYAGEYSVVTVTAGQTYNFTSSVATDLITISADGGLTAAAYGITPLTWVSTIDGPVRFYDHTNDQCGIESVSRTRSVICGIPSTDAPDYVNLQFPTTATITQGGSATVYGQVYEAGLTDVVPNIVGQAPGITAWVGVSPIGANTNPNTWSTWVPATWNAGSVGNNDEYQAAIGANLIPGTYYYATRFQLNNGVYVYGGITTSNDGGFWDGTTYNSGVLTVNAPPIPGNDECAGATSLTAGGIFADNVIDSGNFGATLSSDTPIPSCGAFNFATLGKDVWYSVVVPDSGNITIETGTTTLANGLDTVISAYSGTCGALIAAGCDDDGAVETIFGLSKLSLTAQTPGATLLIRVFGYNGSQGNYSISAYDASLANSIFDNTNFSFYPNPVKNTLNLSYNQEISNVDVFNLLGQKVISTKLNANSGQIEMSSLPNGAYMVTVTSNNQVKTIKVIKQ